jgi:hypothetical protein
MVNPFLVETDDPAEPVSDIIERPASPLRGDATPAQVSGSSRPILANDFAQPSVGPHPTSAADDDHFLAERMKSLELELFHLRKERDEARNSARFYNNEANRLRETREGTYTSNSTYTNEHPRSKIKPSDLPKFFGKDNEDVDEWIEKVSAIFTYSQAKDIDLLRILPLLLHGNASEWFTTLGEEGRARLTSWTAWKAALRNGFYLPDHEMTKQMLCRNRTLKRTESFGDYF